jgi:hypothetical protein
MTVVTKFEGSTGWHDVEVNREAEINRAVLRSGDELALEFRYEGQTFTVLLRRTRGCEFAGTFTAEPKAEVVSGEVVCRFLHAGSDGLLLGKWKENGSWYRWVAELDVVEHFADEKG